MRTERLSILRPGLVLATAAPVPGLAARFELVHMPVLLETALSGLAILGCAFLVTWAAEVAQVDVSQTLAIAVLALIAVLPEYAVDLFLAYRGGQGEEDKQHLAVASMTASNRVLIGIGWALVVLVFWIRAKRREVVLRPQQRTDLGFLLLATLWAFTIPIRGSLSLLDLVILGTLFVAYIIRAAREEVEEPVLIGTAAAIGSLPRRARRVMIVILFAYSAAVILVMAEHFADGLIEIGRRFDISEFFLIQWVVPIASEAPEIVIAILFTLRLKAQAGLGTLISSKVNQWTLLVGTLPLVFAIGGGGLRPDGTPGGFFNPMSLDYLQRMEVFLTAAQSLFAVMVIANLSISRGEAAALLVLFFGQFVIPVEEIRAGFAIVYILLAVGLFVGSRAERRNVLSAVRGVFSRRPAAGPRPE